MSVSFDRDHARIAGDQTSELRWRGQNTKRDEWITRILSRIVVVEQWFCCLWGLICVICGVYGIFVGFDQDSPFTFIQWLGLVQGPILRSTAIACLVVGVVLIRYGLAGLSQPLVQEWLRSVRAYLALASNLFSSGGTAAGFRSDWNGKERYERRPRLHSCGLFALCSSSNCRNRRRSCNCNHQNVLGAVLILVEPCHDCVERHPTTPASITTTETSHQGA
jgi:hypothetical protein